MQKLTDLSIRPVPRQARDPITIFGQVIPNGNTFTNDCRIVLNGSVPDQKSLNRLINQTQFKLTLNNEESFDTVKISASIMFFNAFRTGVRISCTRPALNALAKNGNVPVIHVLHLINPIDQVYSLDYDWPDHHGHDPSPGFEHDLQIEDESLPLDQAPPPLSDEQLRSYFAKRGLSITSKELAQVKMTFSLRLISDYLTTVDLSLPGRKVFATTYTSKDYSSKLKSAMQLYQFNPKQFKLLKSSTFDFDYLLLLLGALISELHGNDPKISENGNTHSSCDVLTYCPLVPHFERLFTLSQDPATASYHFRYLTRSDSASNTIYLNGQLVRFTPDDVLISVNSDDPQIYSKLLSVERIFFNFVESQISSFIKIETQAQALNHTDSIFDGEEIPTC